MESTRMNCHLCEWGSLGNPGMRRSRPILKLTRERVPGKRKGLENAPTQPLFTNTTSRGRGGARLQVGMFVFEGRYSHIPRLWSTPRGGRCAPLPPKSETRDPRVGTEGWKDPETELGSLDLTLGRQEVLRKGPAPGDVSRTAGGDERRPHLCDPSESGQ